MCHAISNKWGASHSVEFGLGQPQSRLGRALGNSQLAGYFSLGAAFEIGQLDGLALRRRQPSDGLAHHIDQSDRLGLVGVGLAPGSVEGVLATFVVGSPDLSPHRVDAPPVGLHAEERPQGAAGGIESLRVGPERGDNFLDHVLGQAGVPRHAAGQAEEERAVSVEDLGHRLVVARSQSGYEEPIPRVHRCKTSAPACSGGLRKRPPSGAGDPAPGRARRTHPSA